MSQDVYDLMSPVLRRGIRQIDRILIKGNANPRAIFTYDTIFSPTVHTYTYFDGACREYKEVDLESNSSGSDEADNPTISFLSDPDIRALRKHITNRFLCTFKEGMDSYIYGDWFKATKIFRQTDIMMYEYGGDSVSRQLLEYIESHGNRSPENWKGYRKFLSK